MRGEGGEEFPPPSMEGRREGEGGREREGERSEGGTSALRMHLAYAY